MSTADADPAAEGRALVPDAGQLAATAASIAAAQLPDGAVPWEAGGQVDAWDHVECLMALDVAGLHEQARAGYAWLRRTQRPDGSWAARYGADGSVTDATAESNHAAYVAVGVAHHWLSGGGAPFLATAWPMLHRALDFVLGLANPDGTIGWARSPSGTADPTALLTGGSSIHHALRCGALVARHTHHPAIAAVWDRAADQLATAIGKHCAATEPALVQAPTGQRSSAPAPGLFADRDRFAMDWYYPVLGGALTRTAAAERIRGRWDRFVVPGRGIRCVSDRPWVTGAETCELAIALAVTGDRRRAAQAVASMQHLREEDGSYWTGLVLEDGVRWPVERSTWTGAAVILATDLIVAGPATAQVFGLGLTRSGTGDQDGAEALLAGLDDLDGIAS